MTQNEKITSIELTLDELKMIKFFLPDVPCSVEAHELLDKINERIDTLENADKRELIAENILKKFGIQIMNPWVINVSHLEPIQIYKELYGSSHYAQRVLTPENKNSRFFKLLPDLDVEEVFPKIVVTKTVEWLDRPE